MLTRHVSIEKGDLRDMTTGNPYKKILYFALPVFLSQVFQQLYNTVDTWVLGKYVNDAAFSAVGAVGPITNMLIGSFTGLASGAGVVVSQYYGAKQHDKLSRTVGNSILLSFLSYPACYI